MAMSFQAVLLAFGVTLLAGLSTGIGSLISLVTRKTSPRFLSVALGFSAGVMIYVSMIDLFPTARQGLSSILGNQAGTLVTIVAFFGGMLVAAVIDRLVPAIENPHEMRRIESMEEAQASSPDAKKRLMRVGVMSALAIGIHNFPEGIATFTAALHEPTLGIAVAVAIAIHNIPEGIAVSVPVYFATGSRRKAFRLSFLSGLSEPVGALIGYAFLAPFLNATTMGVLFAAIAGIMVFISLDELLPAAREYGSPHLAIYGLIGGMMVIALSLLLFLVK
jgi:zinc transporter, ZIP family